MIFNQLITEEPKYQAKALIVATDTINSGGSCSGSFASQRNYYRKISPEHCALMTYTLVLTFPEVKNSSRDFSIDTNLVSF